MNDQVQTFRIPIDELTHEQMRVELALLRATARYDCCCIDGDCDCFTKRDASWRTIPGNYACLRCCNEDCTGSEACPPECVCEEGANCGAFQAAETRS